MRLDRRRFLAVGAAGAVSLAGCLGSLTGPGRSLPAPPGGTWAQYAHDARKSGAAAVTVPERATPAWDSGDAHTAAPLVGDGTVYSVASDATALEGQTGETEWEVDLPGRAEHTPALFEDLLVVAAGSDLVGLARADGTERWSRSLPGPGGGTGSTGALTVLPDRPLVTVPVAEVGLVAYDPRTGDRRWSEPMRGTRPAAVADGTVIALGYDTTEDQGVLRGIDAGSGERLWSRDLELSTLAPPPVVTAEGVLVPEPDGVGVYDPSDGRRLRGLAGVSETPTVPPAVAGDTVYVATDERLSARSLSDGSRAWSVDLRVTSDAGIAVGSDTVVTAGRDVPGASLPAVAALDRGDGSVRWAREIEGFDTVVTTPPTIADGAVFYTSNESLGVVALGDLPPNDGE